MPKPKVAICVAGHMRTWEGCIDSFHKYLKEYFDADVFVVTYDKIGESRKKNSQPKDKLWINQNVDPQQIQDAYKAVDIKILSETDEDKEPFLKDELTKLGKKTIKIAGVSPISTFMQFRLLKESFNFVKEHGEYDYYVRCRPDIRFKKYPRIANPNYIYSLFTGEYRNKHFIKIVEQHDREMKKRFPGDVRVISDILAMGNWDFMERYCTIIDHKDEYIRDQVLSIGEILLGHHMTKCSIPTLTLEENMANLVIDAEDGYFAKHRYIAMQRAEANDMVTQWKHYKDDKQLAEITSPPNPDYNALFQDLDTKGWTALEFGVGIGENITRYKDKFERIDGVDIAVVALEEAMQATHVLSKLMLSNGYSLDEIDGCTYDMVFSTMCLSQIAVHEIRQLCMEEIFRVLVPGGIFAFQLGYGKKKKKDIKQNIDNGDIAAAVHKTTVGWDENKYKAKRSNGFMDAALVDLEKEIFADLDKIGFYNHRYYEGESPAESPHKKYIYIQTRK